MTSDHVAHDADRIARNWEDSLQMLARITGGGTVQGADGIIELRTGIGAPNLNGVLSLTGSPTTQQLADAIRGWEPTGPWSVTSRAPLPDPVIELARDRGLTEKISHPLLTKAVLPEDRDLSLRQGVTVRTANPGGDSVYADVVARGFGAPPVLLEPFGAASVLGERSITGFVVEEDGVPVAASMAVDRAGVTAIVNVAVPPEFRRQGFGATATLAVAHHAAAAGSDTLYLHATPAGLPVYERLGFSVVERWTMLVPSMG